jgi:hypothetical protein
MYLLLNWIKNKYFIFIIVILFLYIINLILLDIISCIDYILILYLCFIELGNKNNVLSLSIITGLLIDLLYSPVIGIYLSIFFLFFITSEIYRNYVDFEKFYIRFLFYLCITVIYINFNLFFYNYTLDAYMVININRLSLDILSMLFSFIIMKRIQRAL